MCGLWKRGKDFPTVEIGGQVWMTENLDIKVDGSRCYGDDENNCKKYGRLYTWDAAVSACPPGWRMPSFDDWQAVFDSVGTTPSEFRAGGSTLVEGDFRFLFGGSWSPDHGYSQLEEFGKYWTSTEWDDDPSGAWEFQLNKLLFPWRAVDPKSYCKSVRCIKV
ncbi:FISUMP domain-containing protein [Gemmatimonadota bacterium]